MAKIIAIEVSFPVDVELSLNFERRLDSLLGEVCETYMAENPDRIMWPFGHGFKITYMPMTRAEEQAGFHMQFDESVYAIEVAERQRFDDEELYHKGDYEWRETTLAIVGYGGWGRKGDWWNR